MIIVLAVFAPFILGFYLLAFLGWICELALSICDMFSHGHKVDTKVSQPYIPSTANEVADYLESIKNNR